MADPNDQDSEEFDFFDIDSTPESENELTIPESTSDNEEEELAMFPVGPEESGDSEESTMFPATPANSQGTEVEVSSGDDSMFPALPSGSDETTTSSTTKSGASDESMFVQQPVTQREETPVQEPTGKVQKSRSRRLPLIAIGGGVVAAGLLASAVYWWPSGDDTTAGQPVAGGGALPEIEEDVTTPPVSDSAPDDDNDEIEPPGDSPEVPAPGSVTQSQPPADTSASELIDEFEKVTTENIQEKKESIIALTRQAVVGGLTPQEQQSVRTLVESKRETLGEDADQEIQEALFLLEYSDREALENISRPDVGTDAEVEPAEEREADPFDSSGTTPAANCFSYGLPSIRSAVPAVLLTFVLVQDALESDDQGEYRPPSGMDDDETLTKWRSAASLFRKRRLASHSPNDVRELLIAAEFLARQCQNHREFQRAEVQFCTPTLNFLERWRIGQQDTVLAEIEAKTRFLRKLRVDLIQAQDAQLAKIQESINDAKELAATAETSATSANTAAGEAKVKADEASTKADEATARANVAEAKAGSFAIVVTPEAALREIEDLGLPEILSTMKPRRLAPDATDEQKSDFESRTTVWQSLTQAVATLQQLVDASRDEQRFPDEDVPKVNSGLQQVRAGVAQLTARNAAAERVPFAVQKSYIESILQYADERLLDFEAEVRGAATDTATQQLRADIKRRINQLRDALEDGQGLSPWETADINHRLRGLVLALSRMEAGRGKVPTIVTKETLQSFLRDLEMPERLPNLRPTTGSPSLQEDYQRHLAMWRDASEQVSVIVDRLNEPVEISPQEGRELNAQMSQLRFSVAQLDTRRQLSRLRPTVSQELDAAQLSTMAGNVASRVIRTLATYGFAPPRLPPPSSPEAGTVTESVTPETETPVTFDPAWARKQFAAGYDAYFSPGGTQVRRAVRLFTDAVKHDPTKPAYRYFLGLALYRVGQPTEAAIQVRTGQKLELQFGNAGVGKALERVQGSLRLWLERVRHSA